MSISIWLLLSTVFIVNIGFGIILPTLPFLSKDMGANAFELGMALSIFALAQLLFSKFWGALSDKYDRKKILIIGILGYGISSAFLAFISTIQALLLLRFLAGFFVAATMPTANALASDWSDLKDRSRVLGFMSAMNGLGFIVGPAVGSFLMVFGLGIPFITAGLLAILNALLAIWLLPSAQKRSVKPIVQKEVSVRQPLISKLKASLKSLVNIQIAPYLLGSFIFAYTDASLMAALAYFIVDYLHSTQTVVGTAFVLIGGVGALVQALVFPRINQKFGAIITIVVGFSLGTIGNVLLGMSNVILWALVAIVLIAFCRGFAYPAVITAISVNSSEDTRGSSFASENTFKSIGRLSGPLVSGWLYTHYGAGSFFFSATVLLLAATILSVWNDQLRRSKNKKRKTKLSNI